MKRVDAINRARRGGKNQRSRSGGKCYIECVVSLIMYLLSFGTLLRTNCGMQYYLQYSVFIIVHGVPAVVLQLMHYRHVVFAHYDNCIAFTYVCVWLVFNCRWRSIGHGRRG